MSITVPDRCILAESNQLIEYSSPSNSQPEALKQKSNALGLSLSCSINWLAIFGGSGLSNKKCSFCRACSTHEHLMGSLDVHSLQTASMYTKKPKEIGWSLAHETTISPQEFSEN